MTAIYFGNICFDTDLIVFDKDGTLFTFDAVWRRPFLTGISSLLDHFDNSASLQTRLFRSLGYDEDLARFRANSPFVVATAAQIRDIATEILATFGQPSRGRAELDDLIEQTMLSVLVEPVEPDIEHMTTDLPTLLGSLYRAGVRCALITNDDRAPTEAMLTHLGLTGYVSYLVAGDDGLPPKPDPQALQSTLTALSIRPQRCAVVGDAVTDLQMGRSVSVGLCVGVLTGPAERPDLAGAAHIVLDSIDSIRVQN